MSKLAYSLLCGTGAWFIIAILLTIIQIGLQGISNSVILVVSTILGIAVAIMVFIQR